MLHGLYVRIELLKRKRAKFVRTDFGAKFTSKLVRPGPENRSVLDQALRGRRSIPELGSGLWVTVPLAKNLFYGFE